VATVVTIRKHKQLSRLFVPFFIAGFIISCPATCPAAQLDLTEAPVYKTILDNGLTLLIREQPGSGLACLEVRIKSGSIHEEEYLASGISHLIEHMIFKGTPTRDAATIERQVKSFGGTINGATSLDTTSYQITVLSGYLPDAADLLKDMLFNPSFDKDELTKEKEVIKNEMRLRRDDPSQRISQLLWERAYQKHPYRYPVIGYEGIFDRLTRDDVVRYHGMSYAPNNMIIAVVGAVDPQATKALLREKFGSLQMGRIRSVAVPKEPPQIAKISYEEEAPINLSYVTLGFHSTSLLHEDLFALDVLSAILGEGNNSRLNTALVKESSIAYTVGVFNYTPEDPGLFLISTITEPERVGPVIQGILKEIKKVKHSPVADDELERVKNSVVGEYIFSRQVIQAVATDITTSEHLTGTDDFSRRYIAGIQAITPQDIQRVAAAYLGEDNLTEIRLNPRKAGQIRSAETRREISSDDAIQKTVLPNGLVILTRRNPNLPAVAISAAILGGLQVETKANNGISQFVSQMLLKGTQSLPEALIADSIQNRGGNITAFSGLNSFGISATLLKADFDHGIELIQDILTRSTFPQDQVEKMRTILKGAIKNEDDAPLQRGMNAFRKELFGGHPFGMRISGEPDTINGLQKADLEAYYRSWCAPNNMVISVSGDIDDDSVIQTISRLFNDFEKRNIPKIKLPAVVPAAEIRSSQIATDKEESVLIMGFATTGMKDKDRYPLELLSSILSGSDGRLSQDLREKFGLAYALGCTAGWGLDTGYFAFYVASSAKDIPAARGILLELLRSLENKGISDEELDLAKKRLSGDMRSSLQTNEFVSFHAALNELFGIGCQETFDFINKINAVQMGDIDRVIKKYLRPGAYTEITMLGND